MTSLGKYFTELEEGSFTRVGLTSELYYDLGKIMKMDLNENTTCVAIRYECQDAENIYFCYCEHG